MKNMFKAVMSILLMVFLFAAFAPADASIETSQESIEYSIDMNQDVEAEVLLQSQPGQVNPYLMTCSDAEPSAESSSIQRYESFNYAYLSDLNQLAPAAISKERYRHKQKMIS